MAGRKPVSRSQTGQLSLLNGADSLGAAVAAREFFHATGGIDKLLFPREKRMASRTDADSNVWTRRASVISRTARADDSGLLIIRMYIRPHGEKGAANLSRVPERRKR